jgi:hypothetical protein
MSHAEVCPVCGGRGWVYPDVGYYDTTPPEYYGGTGWFWKICNGCGGKGWIVVPDGPEDPAASTKINYVPGEEKHE